MSSQQGQMDQGHSLEVPVPVPIPVPLNQNHNHNGDSNSSNNPSNPSNSLQINKSPHKRAYKQTVITYKQSHRVEDFSRAKDNNQQDQNDNNINNNRNPLITLDEQKQINTSELNHNENQKDPQINNYNSFIYHYQQDHNQDQDQDLDIEKNKDKDKNLGEPQGEEEEGEGESHKKQRQRQSSLNHNYNINHNLNNNSLDQDITQINEEDEEDDKGNNNNNNNNIALALASGLNENENEFGEFDDPNSASFFDLLTKFASFNFPNDSKEKCPLCPESFSLSEFAGHVYECIKSLDEIENLEMIKRDEILARQLYEDEQNKLRLKQKFNKPQNHILLDKDKNNQMFMEGEGEGESESVLPEIENVNNVNNANNVNTDSDSVDPVFVPPKVCPDGANCARQDLSHFSKIYHPEVQCPICSMKIARYEIDAHVTVCLEKPSQTISANNRNFLHSEINMNMEPSSKLFSSINNDSKNKTQSQLFRDNSNANDSDSDNERENDFDKNLSKIVTGNSSLESEDFEPQDNENENELNENDNLNNDQIYFADGEEPDIETERESLNPVKVPSPFKQVNLVNEHGQIIASSLANANAHAYAHSRFNSNIEDSSNKLSSSGSGSGSSSECNLSVPQVSAMAHLILSARNLPLKESSAGALKGKNSLRDLLKTFKTLGFTQNYLQKIANQNDFPIGSSPSPSPSPSPPLNHNINNNNHTTNNITSNPNPLSPKINDNINEKDEDSLQKSGYENKHESNNSDIPQFS